VLVERDDCEPARLLAQRVVRGRDGLSRAPRRPAGTLPGDGGQLQDGRHRLRRRRTLEHTGTRRHWRVHPVASSVVTIPVNSRTRALGMKNVPSARRSRAFENTGGSSSVSSSQGIGATIPHACVVFMKLL
jgi:hypothetical protein